MRTLVQTIIIVTIAAVIVVLSACGGKQQLTGQVTGELTRPKAKDLIEKSKEFAPTQAFDVPNERAGKAVTLGYWTPSNEMQTYKPTAKGSPYFGDMTGCGLGLTCRISMAKPVSPKLLEVTGITDGPEGQPGTSKVVDFTWKLDLDSYPPEVRDLLPDATPQEGQATLKLYDDGWRVVELAGHRK